MGKKSNSKFDGGVAEGFTSNMSTIIPPAKMDHFLVDQKETGTLIKDRNFDLMGF